MKPTNEEVLEFYVRFMRLYKSKQKMLCDDVEQITEQLRSRCFDLVKDGSNDSFDMLNHIEPMRWAWHAVWCIVNGATCTMVEWIDEVTWDEAQFLLRKYEQGHVSHGVLIPMEWRDAS